MIRDRFSTILKEMLSEDEWLILQESYNPAENLTYESLFCLTNGYLGTRGSYEEGTARSMACTYINGIFDKSETFMRELANMPDWLGIRLYVEKELIGIENCEIREFTRVLDMKKSLLAKRMILRDAKGRETLIEGARLVSRAHLHRMGIRLYATPLNYQGLIEVESIIDASVINFSDAPRFKVKHTYLTDNSTIGETGAYVEVATRDRHQHVGIGSSMEISRDGENIMKSRVFHPFGEQAVEFRDFELEQGSTAVITKYSSIYTERECEQNHLKEYVSREIDGFIKSGIESEIEGHAAVYARMWEEADIRIEGDFELNRAIRFNIFHLMSTGSEGDDRINVGAKLLHGEEYGGHAFWDTELFMLPFFAHVFPRTAANLLAYRYHLLDAARENAAKNGYKGAQYPWESADDGTEQCPAWTIEPDGTCYRCYVADYEHHVTAAVAYGVYNYVKITRDTDFLYGKGLEILIETARFWASRCEYNQTGDRFEIRQVTGPDEWHEPVDNNLYTNYMAKWNMKYVLELVQKCRETQKEVYTGLNVSEAELAEWDYRQERIYLPQEKDSKLLEQFEGYFKLQEVTIEAYDENDWPIRPAILNQVDKQQTQIIKQADVIMLMYLFPEEFDEETRKLNYAYYEKRTLHGSSLSPSIYSIMGLKVHDASKAYRYLQRAAFLDLKDLQKNTREGIHAANAGGVWQTVIFGFAGVSVLEGGILCIEPRLPEAWSSIAFRLHFREAWLEINISGSQVDIKWLAGDKPEVRINGENIRLD